jgi:hypothetical protein
MSHIKISILILAIITNTTIFSQKDAEKTEKGDKPDKKLDAKAAQFEAEIGPDELITHITTNEINESHRFFMKENAGIIEILNRNKKELNDSIQQRLKNAEERQFHAQSCWAEQKINLAVALFKRNYKDLLEILKDFTQEYRKKTFVLIRNCDKRLAKIEMENIVVTGTGARESFNYKKNNSRLSIAYTTYYNGVKFLRDNKSKMALRLFKKVRNLTTGIVKAAFPKDEQKKLFEEYFLADFN